MSQFFVMTQVYVSHPKTDVTISKALFLFDPQRSRYLISRSHPSLKFLEAKRQVG